MRFNVAEVIARAGKTRQPELVLTPLWPPMGLEADVRRIYMRVVRAWALAARETIMPAYSRSLTEAVRDSPDDMQATLNEVSGDLTRLVIELGPEVEDWVVRVENWHRAAFSRQFTPTGVQLSTLLGAGEVKTTLQSVLNDNTALIRSLNDQLRNDISGAVFRGLTNRTTAADVAREIRARTGVATSRAKLIAADQLQKLTSRLDQERQEQVGIAEFEWAHSRKKNPREIHKARDGKRYRWDSAIAKSDPPGRAIRCGCRARPVVKLDPVEAIDPTAAPVPVAAPPPMPRAPRAAPPPPIIAPPAPTPPPVGAGYRSVVNRAALSNENLTVSPRLKLAKALTAEFKEAATDARYADDNNWRGQTANDYGKASLSNTWSDEAASAVAAVMPELNALADQMGLPRLRGIKTTNSRVNASMGGGVLSVNPAEFNARVAARGAGGTDELTAELSAKAQAIIAERETVRQQLNPIWQRMNELPFGSPERAELRVQSLALSKKNDSLRLKLQKINAAAGRARSAAVPETTYKKGDDLKTRPWSVQLYYPEGVDRIRSTLFHEFAHHVHQQYKREGGGRFSKRPIEARLSALWRGPEGRDRFTRQPSQYATTNEHEWFAENFSLYVMGKADLVDPVLLELIEDIFNGRI